MPARSILSRNFTKTRTYTSLLDRKCVLHYMLHLLLEDAEGFYGGGGGGGGG